MAVQQTTTALPPITDTQEQAAREAFKLLHSAFGGYGATQYPNFADMDLDGYAKLAQRAIGGIQRARQARREQQLATIRTAIAGVVEAAVSSLKSQKVAYDAMVAQTSEAMRGFIAPFPTSVKIPLAQVSDAFPQGTQIGSMLAVLKEMSYQVISTGKGKETSYSLSIPVPFTTATK